MYNGKLDVYNNIHVVVSDDGKLRFFHQDNHNLVGITMVWGYNNYESQTWIDIEEFKKMIKEFGNII
jgi:hypothetical protein